MTEKAIGKYGKITNVLPANEYHDDIELVCNAVAPGLSMQDLLVLFHEAFRQGNDLSSNPNKNSTILGITAVINAVVAAMEKSPIDYDVRVEQIAKALNPCWFNTLPADQVGREGYENPLNTYPNQHLKYQERTRETAKEFLDLYESKQQGIDRLEILAEALLSDDFDEAHLLKHISEARKKATEFLKAYDAIQMYEKIKI